MPDDALATAPYFSLKRVVPFPMQEIYDPASEVWGKELRLDLNRRYQIKALSGKGKSSLIAFLYGLRKDFYGSIRLGSLDLETLSPTDWSRLRCYHFSAVFQDLKLFRDRSGRDNILVKTTQTNEAPPIDPWQAARDLQVDRLLEKKVKFLSFGERQRVAILRALSQPFRFLFLDEPFSHLDAERTEAAAHWVREACRKQGAGFLLTTLGPDYGLDYNETKTV